MNLYRIIDKNGVTLCFQAGKTEKDAIHSAKTYHGHKSAAKAEFVKAA